MREYRSDDEFRTACNSPTQDYFHPVDSTQPTYESNVLVKPKFRRNLALEIELRNSNSTPNIVGWYFNIASICTPVITSVASCRVPLCL